MRSARLLTAVFLSLALVPGAQALRNAQHATQLAAPASLTPFLLRPGEAVPADHAFARTPSFAWKPVRGAQRYEFELSKDPAFNEGSVFWSSNQLTSPTVAVPVSLPWMTSGPCPQVRCAVYAHVRAIAGGTASAWSSAYGFNLRWTALPTDCTLVQTPTAGCPDRTQYPGLIRWSTVDGASAYDVWFTDGDRNGKVIETPTNVADERDYYTFHQASPSPDVVHWRVRAVRRLYGSVPNGLPAVIYGPWSQTFTTKNPPFAAGKIKLGATVADVSVPAGSNPKVAGALTPGFTWTGNQALDGKAAELYRVYVFTDSDCVNMIFRGSIVGSPAYAPRSTGPLELPTDPGGLQTKRSQFLDTDGKQPVSYMADTSAIERPTEADPPSGGSSGSDGGSSSGSDGGSTTTSGGTSTDPDATVPPANDGLPSTPAVTGAPVDLWDSGWPNGHFYWTVVPVQMVVIASGQTSLAVAANAGDSSITVSNVSGFVAGSTIGIGVGAAQETRKIVSVGGTTLTLDSPLTSSHPAGTAVLNAGSTIEYHDLELPQDVCAAGRVAEFGKKSDPVVTAGGSNVPYAAGLSPTGRLLAASSAKPSFYGTPLVAWKPALAADEYEVQWSRTLSPWNPYDASAKKLSKLTFATSTLLPLTPGRWYYRVRGLDFSLPGTARAMSWSKPVALTVAKPRFRVVGR